MATAYILFVGAIYGFWSIVSLAAKLLSHMDGRSLFICLQTAVECITYIFVLVDL